jgi:nicotinic acid mononucleotide adenylyltransferase
MYKETIDSLAVKGIPTVFYITGGGTGAISHLLEQGGGSSFMLEAQVPYNRRSVIDLLGGHTPDQFCCLDTAKMLATSAYQRASLLAGTDSVIGVGATSKLRHDSERQGRQHRVCLAIHSKDQTKTIEVPLGSTGWVSPRSRLVQEDLTSRLIVKQYCDFVDVPCVPPALATSEMPELQHIKSAWTLDSSESVHMIPYHNMEYCPRHIGATIFSGSFNPIHQGHIKVAELAYQRTGSPVWFELSLTNCSKPMIDWVSLEQRLHAIHTYRNNPAIAGVVCTKAPLFVQKAVLFKNATFVVGRDTILRIDNQSFYPSRQAYIDGINELIQRSAKFLVFDRKGTKDIPFRHLGLDKICTTITDYVDNGENSTEIRKETCRVEEDS